jgi:Protein of unknown function (DUF1311).
MNRARLFVAALDAKESNIIAGMIKYPLKATFQDGEMEINDPDDLLTKYDVLFDQDFIQTYSDIDPKNIANFESSNDLSVQDGNYGFVLNSSGMVVEIRNVTKTITSAKNTPTPAPTPTLSSKDCYNSAKTQEALDDCASVELENVKSTLQALMKELMPMLSNGIENTTIIPYDQVSAIQKLLPEWQQTFQDHCNWEANMGNEDSSHSLIFTQCMTIQYKQLINDMRWYLCDGGGMGGCDSSDRYKQDF